MRNLLTRANPFQNWNLSSRAERTLIPFCLLAALDFLSYFSIALCLGGEALNGYARGSRYYFVSHGLCLEVSRAVWTYSYWHGVSVFTALGIFLAMTGLFVKTGDISFETR